MKFKFIFSLFFAMLSYFSVAQQVNNTEFKTKTLQVFQNLDKNRVPHGILLDFGMEFTNLQAFNGTLTDSTYTNSQTMSDIYKTLLMCRVRSNVTTGFITPQEYATRWYSQRTKGVITLSAQYFKYNRFADNAYPNKINYSNNQFSDKFVGSVWQNPYEEKQLFAMTTSIAKYKGLNFQVKLPSNLFLTNYPATVQNIQVDFSDGLGYRIVAQNQLINVNYTQANIYTWKYKITLTNGQTLLSHSKIEIETGLNAREITAPCVSCPQSMAQTTAQQATNLSPFYKTTITSTTLYNGYYGSATVYIRYASGTTITKPLIVAEGFDTGIILNPEQEAGDNNIDQFIKSTEFIRSNSSALEGEINTYDIIYVDWNNGVDFLQRNAFVLEDVIKWVNQNKSGSQQNVVLGQSMGGLIARYALKDMENKGLNHQTRMYVSHDAPHLGANTPLSVQHSARHLRNMYINTPIPLLAGEVVLPLIYNFAEGFSAIINFFGGNTNVDPFITPLQAFSLADVPAARQMQFTWVSNSYQMNNTIHDAWQQELSNLGYPVGYPAQGKPIRNIAIANGSECGVTQIDNGNIMSYVKDAGRNTFLSNYIGIMDAIYGTLITNPLVVITALFPGNSYWQIDFQSKYMTTFNENKNIYHGSIKYKKKIFWFIPVSITITEKNVNQPAGVLPYDIYGGGQQKTSSSQLPLSGITSNTFGFIPTASALDIGKGTTVINDVDYRKSYVGALPPALPKNSPFQNFVTHFDQFNPNNNNSRHISFNRRNGNWLRTELNTGIADEYSNCSYMCASTQITGANLLCTSATYTAPSGGTFYNWTITQGASLVTLSGNGTPNVTLTALPNATGQLILSLNMGDGNLKCGNITIVKTIWIGKPNVNLVEEPVVSSWDLTLTDPTNNNFSTQGITSITWTKLSGNGVLSGNGYYAGVDGSPTRAWTITIKISITNSCGTTEIIRTYNNPDGDHDPHTDRISNTTIFTIHPNPSNDIVNIEIRDANNLPEKGATISGELFDIMGQSKSKVEINNNKATFSVRGLNKGIYVLKIYISNTIKSHQIAVE
ncbi:Secretion system C-terminal sorting domain-containing protein [Flavobacterium branchiophilum]|uniref:Uncharacterized protein n=1 Tax=Flavobacterium branchiophilum (strain FL-15) TaxID=1034807 RepID=G2Z255_FLABF|nr:T9SS type A sorting domain-containing protein [Flavobacterium branchiophilum]CCB70009.1 Protein of unknown function precursor [Flavobacterium branchiophilum FL-15]